MTDAYSFEDVLAASIETHDLDQRDDAWHVLRLQRRGASEAAAMLGLSKNVKRTELLRAKSTGIAKEFSDWVQENILNHGHEVEALARALLEEDLGEDLYPVTFSRGPLLASSDGVPISHEWGFEHKQWNEELAASVRAGKLPVEHRPQCQQQMLVGGLRFVKFVVSDGTREKRVMMDVYPDESLQRRIVAGWNQFDRDLAEFKPAAPVEKLLAEPVEALPAPVVKVSGELALTDNFKVFEERLRHFLEHKLIRKPETDEDFVNLDAQIRAMKAGREALKSAKAQMLAQVQPVDQASKTADMLDDLLQQNCAMAERLLDGEKLRRKTEIVTNAQTALSDHLRALNKRLGRDYMPQIAGDFGAAIKGKKNLASMQDAVDTVLANAKIEANAIADKIDFNLKVLAGLASDHIALFPDARTIVLKAADDFQSLVTARVAEHDAAVKRRAEEAAERERARIRQEEEARAQRLQQEREATERRQREEAEAAQRRADQSKLAYSNGAPMFGKHVKENGDQVMLDEHGNRSVFCDVDERDTATPVAAAVPPSARNTAPTLTLGQIGVRLGFPLTAEFLRRIGFEPAGRARAAVLYHDADFDAICAALIEHVESVREGAAA